MPDLCIKLLNFFFFPVVTCYWIQVKEEIKECYKLIEKLGRGVLYLGSSRFKPDHPHYLQTMELGREVSQLR